MTDERTIHLVDIPMGGTAGTVWNSLHEEREQICELLIKEQGLIAGDRRQWLQKRLRKIDDALDRLMSGSYGKGTTPRVAPANEATSIDEVVLERLNPFDTILLQTHNSEYRILLLDPMTGRALVEGGNYLTEPTEGLVRGSAAVGDIFNSGTVTVGCRVEIWVAEKAFLTSPVTSISVKRNEDAKSTSDISAALH